MKNQYKLFRAGKMVLLIIIVFNSLSLIASAQTSKSDFSGTWNLNESKSQLGEGPGRRTASKIVITQDAATLTAERNMTRQSGETVVMKEKYNLDGTESDNSGENRKKKSTATWAADGQSLTINSTSTFERNGNTMEMKSTEVYKLSSDKKTLTIESTMNSPRGKFKATSVYDLSK
ncbi:MAG TPA: hypothetical protein VHO90_10240 [Bacteroidales bacterium]|nr:hypothetical protein [Bacteroidales bacterium]